MTSQTLIDDAFRPDGFSASAMKAVDTDVASEVRLMPADELRDGVVRMGLWRAEPGTYHVPEEGPGETFIVLLGKGVAEIEGHAAQDVGRGSIVVVPPNTRARLTVDEPLLKVFVAPLDSRGGAASAAA